MKPSEATESTTKQKQKGMILKSQQTLLKEKEMIVAMRMKIKQMKEENLSIGSHGKNQQLLLQY